jgi:hypothetical protein
LTINDAFAKPVIRDIKDFSWTVLAFLKLRVIVLGCGKRGINAGGVAVPVTGAAGEADVAVDVGEGTKGGVGVWVETEVACGVGEGATRGGSNAGQVTAIRPTAGSSIFRAELGSADTKTSGRELVKSRVMLTESRESLVR